MASLKPMDSYQSFKAVEAQVDQAVRKGELSREDARQILKEAKKSYSEQHYNKALAKHAS